ncbi:MAG: MFS transporter [Spirochaetaceae bacterium]|nr:MAG: MFS transporter [Spirochaetaceae bacterium]
MSESHSGRRLFWLFGTGDLTTSAPLAIIAFFQLFFLTDVARLSPAYAGLAILLGKLWDAVNDPVVGVLADRVRSRFGRRRVLLLAGAVPVGLSFLLMWIVPPLSTPFLIAYYTATYIIFDTCFTVVGVAYNSLTPTLTSDYDEQSSLNGIRMVYSISGSLLAVIIGTVLQWVIDDEGRLFVLLGVIVGAVIAIPPLVVARAVKERDTVSGGVQPPTLRGIRQVLENRPFRAAMGVYLTSWTAVTLIAANLVYYARYNLGIPDQANYFVLVAQGVALLFIPVSVGIARRWDKRAAAFVGFGTMVPVLVAIALVSPERYRMVYALAALLGLGIATAYVTPWSMIPDVIQWDTRETGSRREATYYAVVSFVQKLGTALALWVVAQALDASGYVTPTVAVPLPVQPVAALSWIRAFLTIVPAGLLLAAMAFASIYPITRSVHADITAELEERGI